jgi:hypothetical protein
MIEQHPGRTSIGFATQNEVDMTLKDGWIPTKQPHRKDQNPGKLSIAEAIGNEFTISAILHRHGLPVELPIPKKGRRVLFEDRKTNQVNTISLHDTPDGFHPSDLHHITIDTLHTIDLFTVKRSLSTEQSIVKNATLFHDVNKDIIKRGGDPTYRVSKSEQDSRRFTKK